MEYFKIYEPQNSNLLSPFKAHLIFQEDASHFFQFSSIHYGSITMNNSLHSLLAHRVRFDKLGACRSTLLTSSMLFASFSFSFVVLTCCSTASAGPYEASFLFYI